MERSKQFVSRCNHSLLQFTFLSLTAAVPFELELSSFNSSKLRFTSRSLKHHFGRCPTYVNAHTDTSTKTTKLVLPKRSQHLATLGLHQGACTPPATPRWHIAHRATATPRHTFRCGLAMDYRNLTGRPTPKVRHTHCTANLHPCLPLTCAPTSPFTDTSSPALLQHNGTSRCPTTLP